MNEPRGTPVRVFEYYKGYSIYYDEVSSQYMAIVGSKPVANYSIIDIEREIDFYLSKGELI